MANVCLMPMAIDKFKTGIRSGAIDPAKLATMTSAERREFFEAYAGKDGAKDVNALFESKLLLKNQQKGMVTWAKTVSGMKPEARRDLISRIQKLDRVLDPDEEEDFLRDLASQKLGVGVTQEEAKRIADLSKNIEDARGGVDRLDYGRAVVAMKNYVNDLKVNEQRFTLSELKSPGKLATRLAGNAKAINASMDNSAIFRQGWKAMWTNPGIWQKNARQSFINIAKQFGGKNVLDELDADIISRPNYNRMIKAKLAVGNLEEAFPTTAPEKIPFIGRAYKASEAGYTAFVQKTRADVFDKYLEIAKKSGVNIDDETELKAIGSLVNSLTGRGNLGSGEAVGNTVNNVFFSPRFLKSNIDTLTAHTVRLPGEANLTPFAKKQAAKNLLKVVTGTASIFAIANMIKPGSVELDPRSSDFGKIKVGHTRFDISGGMGSIATLAARLATMSSKSASTGQVSKLNSGKYGSSTGMDVFNDFIANKLSPAAGVLRDLLKGETPSGDKPTIANEAKSLVTPIGIQGAQANIKDPEGANLLVTMLADGLGIAANTYGGNKKSPWETSTSKELAVFKSKVGTEKFQKASDKYNTQLNTFMDNIVKNPDYKKLPQEKQQQVITKKKDKLQSDIFKENHFRYRRARPDHQLDKFLK